jgi:methyl-accepting chemotaxis protein
MTPSQATTDEAFSIERMSFGGGASSPESATPSQPSVAAEDVTVNRLIRQLADDIARAVGTALRGLDREHLAEGPGGSQKLADRIEFLVAGLDQVRQKTEQLGATVSEQGSSVRTAVERCDVLAVQLRQAEGAREAATVSLRQQTDDVSARVTAVVERLDRQGEALRGFVEFRHRMTGALEQVAGLVAGLQGSAPPPTHSESL